MSTSNSFISSWKSKSNWRRDDDIGQEHVLKVAEVVSTYLNPVIRILGFNL